MLKRSSGDRTSEFRRLCAQAGAARPQRAYGDRAPLLPRPGMPGGGGGGGAGGAGGYTAPGVFGGVRSDAFGEPAKARPSRSEFHAHAQNLAQDITRTVAKLQRLAKITRDSRLSDDRSSEISEYTLSIKQDMSELNQRFRALQEMLNDSRDSSNKHLEVHHSHVVSTLKSKLMDAKDQFEQVLRSRTENLRTQHERRSKFVGDDSKVRGGSAPAWRTPAPQMSANAVAVSESTEQRGGGALQQLMPGSAGGQLATRQESASQMQYYQARADAVQQIESTLMELGRMFQDLAMMVQEQEAQVERIDTNIERAFANVQMGQGQLAIYLDSLQSNKWLILKVFGVLFLFILFFTIFVM